MRQWEHGGIPCAPDLFLLPAPGSRRPTAGNICLSSPHAAGGGTSSARRQARGRKRQKKTAPYGAESPNFSTGIFNARANLIAVFTSICPRSMSPASYFAMERRLVPAMSPRACCVNPAPMRSAFNSCPVMVTPSRGAHDRFYSTSPCSRRI